MRQGDLRNMDMKRRKIIGLIAAAPLLGIGGSLKTLSTYIPQLAEKGIKPLRYPGKVIPLKEEKVKQKGDWTG